MDDEVHRIMSEDFDRLASKITVEVVQQLNNQIYSLSQENNHLRAELTKWKPPWEDAPELAERLIWTGAWGGKDMVAQKAFTIVEERP